MEKHRGFPGRLPGTDFQFTIRRAAKDGPTKIIRRERFRDRRPPDRRADEGFMAALWAQFGEEPFMRGNLDAARLTNQAARFVGIAVNTSGLDAQDAGALVRELEDAHGVPCVDPMTMGVGPIVDRLG